MDDFLRLGYVPSIRFSVSLKFCSSVFFSVPDMAANQKFPERYVKNRTVQLRVHANRLGKLCVVWSNLEMDVTLLLSQLMAIRESAAKNTILGLMDFREKIQACLAIGLDKRPTNAWFESLSPILNEIDNVLRPERNRMIHDFWIGLSDGTVQRSQLKPKVIKPQAHQRKLVLAEYKPVTPDEISKLNRQIEAASVNIILHKDAYIRSGRRRLSLPQKLPDRPDPGHTK